MKTVSQRMEFGKSRRRAVSRGAQGELRTKHRNFDPIQVLLSSTEGRRKDLLPIKYLRMSHSPFAFFRGAVSVMAADLARLPYSGLHVQLCGDAHVQNMGSFASPAGNLIFDLNDFDETIRGPWEWDGKRMAASLILAGREARNSERQCKDAVLCFSRTYRETMRDLSELSVIELARYQVTRHLKVSPVLSVLRKAEHATPQRRRQDVAVEKR